MSKEVKVFGFWASPYSHRVELALSLKGVPYEYIEEDILKNKSDLILKYNPIYKKVPVFLHKGKPIVESIVILEYIEETWKVNPILPQNPYDKAIDRFWIKFIDDKCLPAVRKATFSPENVRETAVEEACECLKTLESALNGKRFFGGDAIGMVDIAANFLTIWLRTIQEATGLEVVSVEKFPDLFKWTEDFISCSVVKESLPPTDKLLSFVKASLSQ